MTFDEKMVIKRMKDLREITFYYSELRLAAVRDVWPIVKVICDDNGNPIELSSVYPPEVQRMLNIINNEEKQAIDNLSKTTLL